MNVEDLNNYLLKLEKEYKKIVQYYEEQLRHTNKDNEYYRRYLYQIHCFNAKRETLKLIMLYLKKENCKNE